MDLFLLITILAVIGCTDALSSILVPLYSYPSTKATWQPLYSALSAYPKLTFQIIVNPASGPGKGQYPDANYRAGVSRLGAFPNAVLLGYVDTNYSHRALSEVKHDVVKYAGWSNYQKLNIALDGIFFDLVPGYDQDESSWKYMRDAAMTVHNHINREMPFVSFNPGYPGKLVTRWLDLADQVLVVEYMYRNYHGQETLDTVPAEGRNQEAVMLYKTPRDTNVTQLVRQIANNGFGATYVTDDGVYGSLKLLDKVASAAEKQIPTRCASKKPRTVSQVVRRECPNRSSRISISRNLRSVIELLPLASLLYFLV